MKFLNIEITFLRGSAMLAVFSLSLVVPIAIYNCLRETTNNLLIRQNLESIKNWAAIERFKTGSYSSIENNVDITNNKQELAKLGGEMEIYISADGNNYCAKSHLSGIKKNKIWCIDSNGYSGEKNNCSKEITRCE
jgi:hypothetical protein